MDSSKAYRPGDTVKLTLQTESQALVALGAVDTALYAVGGKSHKPLDMVKVGQVLSLILPSLRGSSPAARSPCQPLELTQLDCSQSSLKPWPWWSLFPFSLSLFYLSGPCSLTCS